MSDTKTGATLTETVQEKYGALARQVTEKQETGLVLRAVLLRRREGPDQLEPVLRS